MSHEPGAAVPFTGIDSNNTLPLSTLIVELTIDISKRPGPSANCPEAGVNTGGNQCPVHATKHGINQSTSMAITRRQLATSPRQQRERIFSRQTASGNLP